MTAVQRVIDDQNKRGDVTYFSIKENLYPLIVYTLILCVLAAVVFFIFRNRAEGLSAVIGLIAGYASRMAMSLSPTIYASGIRTYTPLILSLLIVVVMIAKELDSDFQKRAFVGNDTRNIEKS